MVQLNLILFGDIFSTCGITILIKQQCSILFSQRPFGRLPLKPRGPEPKPGSSNMYLYVWGLKKPPDIWNLGPIRKYRGQLPPGPRQFRALKQGSICETRKNPTRKSKEYGMTYFCQFLRL